MKDLEHQITGRQILVEQEIFFLGDDTGTGKSRTYISAMCSLWHQQKVDVVLLVCPNTVKENWSNPQWGELSKHMDPEIPTTVTQINSGRRFVAPSAKHLEEKRYMDWIVVNYEALRQEKTQQFIKRCVKGKKAAMCLDESTRIKNMKAEQTKACHRLAAYFTRRTCMSATAIAKNVMDLFSQFWFLDKDILGHRYFTTYRAEFAVMGGYCVNNRPVQIVGYKNLDVLKQRISGYYRSVKKEDCPDLAYILPKTYERREIPLAKDQIAAYKAMKNKLMIEVGGHKFKAKIALTKLLRLNQICAGFLSDETDEEQIIQELSSPKIKELISIMNDNDQHTVIFCQFKHEIAMVCKALEKEGYTYSQLHGGIKGKDRGEEIRSFQDGEKRAIVCQIATGGIGITLTRGTLVVYLSNSFSLEHRYQSEDRTHRIGQKASVTYIDLISTIEGRQTVDHLVMKTIKEKQKLSDQVLTMEDV